MSFDLNGGEGNIRDKTVLRYASMKEPNAPTKEHYDFVGWYVDGVKVDFPYVVTQNTEFVAEYAPTKYTVSYVVNDGSMPSEYTSEYTIETGATLPTPIKDLSVFDGWYEDAKFEGEKVTSIPVGEFGNKTFYAKWLDATDGIRYERSDDGTYYTVIGYNGSDTVVIIPNRAHGVPVISIAKNAFWDNQQITRVVIPDSVTSIGTMAFYNCDNLTSVVIGDSVTSIGGSVFADCDSLVSVTIPDSVTSIGNYAFSNCYSLASIVIPDGVTSIGDAAFSNCYSLASVVIPNSVTTIGSQAFSSCYSLTSVVIPNSVTSIGDGAFNYCSFLHVVYNNSDLLLEIGSSNNGYLAYYAKILVDNGETIYANDGYNYTLTDDGFLFREMDSKYELIAYIGGDETVTLPTDINGNSYDLHYMRGVRNVIIPEGFTAINDYAFPNCSSLVSVTIPDSVTSIGNYAFSGCDNLVSIVIGNSVTYIGYDAFYRVACYNDESNWIDGVLYIGNYLIEAKYNISGEYVIKEGTIAIATGAFKFCDSIVSVVIPNSVISIGDEAFGWCSSLTSIVIPDSVTYIGYEAFSVCNSLTSVVIGDGVTYIENGAFSSCYSLTSVVIGSGVTSIGSNVFSSCDNLTDIYYNGTYEDWYNISIGMYNDELKNATRYYYSETEPETFGYYWHWVDGEVVVWGR